MKFNPFKSQDFFDLKEKEFEIIFILICLICAESYGKMAFALSHYRWPLHAHFMSLMELLVWKEKTFRWFRFLNIY